MSNVPILEEPSIVFLLDTARKHTPSADKSNPWLEPVANGNSVTIKENPLKVGGFSDQKGFLTSLAFGCFAEVVLKQAEFMQLPLKLTSAISDINDKTQTIAIEFDDQHCVNTDCKMEVVRGVAKRYTERNPKFNKPKIDLNYEKLKENVEILGCGLDVFSKNDDAGLEELANLAGVAEEMRFQSPLIHAELVSAVDWDNTGEGISLKSLKLDGPTLFALKHIIRHWPRLNFLNKLKLYKMLGIEGARNPIKNSPITLCFSSKSYEKQDLFNCGRALYRTWFSLTELGLVAQPYAAIGTMCSDHFNFEIERLEQKRKDFSSELGSFLKRDAPCMLLRVGQL